MPRTLPLFIAVLFAAWNSAAHGDGTEPPAQKLPTVVVTAQTVPEDEHEVPVSIVVIDGQKLDRAKIDTLDDASHYAANVDFTRNYLYVRGVGSNGLSSFDPSVAIFIDGVYFGRATAALSPLLDLEQVEIVRGPQGALLGKNTIGGAILLTTAQPESTPGGSVTGLLGSLAERSFKGAANVPLADDFALRIALLGDRRDGYTYNTTQQREVDGRALDGGRAKLAWNPPGSMSGWLSVEAGRLEQRGFGSQLTAATPESLALFRQYDPATETDRTDSRTSYDLRDTYERRGGGGTTLAITWRPAPLTVTSLTNFSRSRFGQFLDQDFTPVPLVALREDEIYRQFSQEVRAHGNWGPVDYIGGAYYFRAELGAPSVITAFPEGEPGLTGGGGNIPPELEQALAAQAPSAGPQGYARDESRKRFLQHDTSLAVFAEARWALTQSVSATGGLRWDRERKDVHAANSFENSGAVFTEFLGEQAYDETRSRAERQLSPRLALQYAATKDISCYASYARGYKGGGFNSFAPTPDRVEFEPERSATLEAGSKALLLDHTLAINLDVFLTDYRNLQLTAYDGSHVYVQNAARAGIDGAELEARWSLGEGWNATMSAGWLDARYRSFPNAPPKSDASRPPGTSAPPQDLGGQPLSIAPRVSGMVGVEFHSEPFGPSLVARAGLDALYRSGMFTSTPDDPLDYQTAYWQFNAHVQVGPSSGTWSLMLVGRNLGGAVIENEGASIPLFEGDHFGRFDAGRSWVGSLEHRW